jgi:RHS repeat-associated protein
MNYTETKNDVIKTMQYSYDNNGNLLTRIPDTVSETAPAGEPNLNLIRLGKYAPVKTGAINTYNRNNQLVEIVQDSFTMTNRYNGEGLRVEKKTEQEATTTISRYLYQSDRVILEVDENNQQQACNVYGANLIRRTEAGQTLYYIYNGHGDVTGLTDGSGNIVVSYYYDAFGNITEQTGSNKNPIKYARYHHDEESDLYYLQSRFYDPAIARFIQEDTYRGNKADPLSLNRYTYCNNEPMMYYDPTGHSLLGIIIGGAIIGGIIAGVVSSGGSGGSSGGGGGSSGGGGGSSGSSNLSSNSAGNNVVQAPPPGSNPVWNRFGEIVGYTYGPSYTDFSSVATNTMGGLATAGQQWTNPSDLNTDGGNRGYSATNPYVPVSSVSSNASGVGSTSNNSVSAADVNKVTSNQKSTNEIARPAESPSRSGVIDRSPPLNWLGDKWLLNEEGINAKNQVIELKKLYKSNYFFTAFITRMKFPPQIFAILSSEYPRRNNSSVICGISPAFFKPVSSPPPSKSEPIPRWSIPTFFTM